jgi:prepilin-type N-terminal cleavage/methylation domain-containing protein
VILHQNVKWRDTKRPSDCILSRRSGMKFRSGHAANRRRRGFTLLELLLASVAAALLMSAVYVAFDITIQQTQVARDAAATEDLTRAIINNFAVDIGGVLGPLAPQSGGTSSAQLMYTMPSTSSTSPTGSSVSSGSGSTGTTVSSSGSSTSTGGSSSSSSSSGSSTTMPYTIGSGVNIPLQAGVIGGYEGNLTMLVLFTSRVPDMFTTTGSNSLAQLYNQNSSNDTVQYPADLRRVVYWLGENGGLYRQETQWPTGLYSWSLSDVPVPDESGSLIAQEVKDLMFEYLDPYDGWVTSWDGTGSTQPPDFTVTGTSPGPPVAIRVTLTFEFENPRGGPPIKNTIVQVFPILSAAGQVPQILYDPTAAAGSSSSSSSSNSGTQSSGTSTGSSSSSTSGK